MRQLDLVWQARVYVNQAKLTISAAQKTRLLAMAQRLLAINAKDVDGLTLVNTLVLPGPPAGFLGRYVCVPSPKD
jgi:hypothetical protein